MEPKIRIKIIQIVLLFSFCGIITEKVFSQPTPPPSGPDFQLESSGCHHGSTVS